VTREVSRNGGQRGYRAARVDLRALELARRPKLAKLAASPRLRAEVERRLFERWSPQQIAARLRFDFPDDPEMRVSHETIYQSLYVQTRGALRRELASRLRSGRSHRRSRGFRMGGNLREDHSDRRAAGGGRRPCRARPLGRRLDHRQGGQIGDRDARRTPDALHDARSAPRRDALPSRCESGRTGRSLCRHARGHGQSQTTRLHVAQSRL
jgi:hypothetical protein